MNDISELDYISSELQRLKEQSEKWALYNYGMPPLPGYKWLINEWGIHEVIDNTKLSKEHIAFIQYSEGNNNCIGWNEDEAYQLWEEQELRPTLNGMFQLVYKYKIAALIPDFNLLSKTRSYK